MAERIADNAEHIVDEMKRKARRRLVGAIVLALAAAIILPLLLEKEPRPLGDDVSVQIPPVDEGKFVNRLTGKAGDAEGAAEGREQGDRRRAGQIRRQARRSPPSRRPHPRPRRRLAAATDGEEGGGTEGEQRGSAPSPMSAPKADAKVAAAATPASETKPQRRPRPKRRRPPSRAAIRRPRSPR